MIVPTAVYALALAALATADSFSLVKSYQGKDFFNGWEFYNNYDNLTNGDVFYVSGKTAGKSKLAYVDGNGQAIMRVDNTTKLSTFGSKRNSVRIATAAQFALGSVWVADMAHVPFGCSVWPAFWSSARVWPAGGEIDTLEGVNAMPRQQMGLHTADGCAWSNGTVQSSALVNATDCSVYGNGNQGCVVTNPSYASYGAEFAAAGGGVWVTQMLSTGIAIWFFNRTSIPSSLSKSATSLDTSTLGLPVANFTSPGCDVPKFFSPQQLIFDISLCGDYAGAGATFGQTCSGFCTQDYVLGDGSAYNDAYFSVGYVSVFGVPGQTTMIGAAAATRPALAALGAVAALAVGVWVL